MSADGFCSLTHPDAGFNLIYLRTGLPTFTPSSASGTADGLLVVFTVGDIDTDYARLCDEGVDIVTPIETEPWGERYFRWPTPTASSTNWSNGSNHSIPHTDRAGGNAAVSPTPQA